MKRWSPSARVALGLGLLAMLLFATVDAGARLGGGQSYGGGGNGGGGGGGGCDGELAVFLVEIIIRLLIHYPQIGVPLLIVAIVVGVMVYNRRQSRWTQTWSSSGDVAIEAHHPDPDHFTLSTVNRGIHDIREADPAFSRFVLSDFLGLLFTRYYEALGRGREGSGPLAGYFAPALMERLTSGTVAANGGASSIVIGAQNLLQVGVEGRDRARVQVMFEANLTQGDGDGTAYYLKERWTLERRLDAVSPAPEAVKALACPACGAAEETTVDGACTFCGNVLTNGDFGWVVQSIDSISYRPVKRIETKLGAGGIEPGYHMPTRFMHGFGAEKRAFGARNPQFSWTAFDRRVRDVFVELQQAWSSLEFERARPYETDHLFQTHRYWIERYRRDGLRNVLDEISIETVIPCRVEQDAWYETITVRIFAAMVDYTVETATGKVVGGHKTKRRKFTEYWTLVRRSGAPDALEVDVHNCPSCGSALDQVSMAGVCGYCQAKIVSGQFGWTLALIEQDEAYMP